MKLVQLEVQNFRGLRNLSVDLPSYTTLIGPNNACKSTVLKAIETFIDLEKPSLDDWHDGDINQEMIIAGVFKDIQNWERNTSGVAGIIENDEIRLRLVAVYQDGKVKTEYQAYKANECIQGWHEEWEQLSEEISAIARTLDIRNKTGFQKKANKEIIKTKIREERPDLIVLSEPEWTSDNISISQALKQALPNVVVIPATFKISDDMKTTGKSPFNKLMESIVIPAVESTEEYENFKAGFDELVQRIKGDDDNVVEEIQQLTLDLNRRLGSVLPSTTAKITLSPLETSKIVGGNATIRLNDGYETDVDRQGHGAQRSLIFALIETLAKSVALIDQGIQKNSIILFEEPELYLHPHLLKRLNTALSSIAENERWQIICTTHSPFLIDVANSSKSMIILSKDSNRDNVVRQITHDPFVGRAGEKQQLRALLDFHPTVSEAFFAKRVLLVEGDTEVAFLSNSEDLVASLGLDMEIFRDTTIISCDGKWTIIAIARLLKILGIPFKIAHDIDAKDRTPEQLESLQGNDPYRANERIAELVENRALIFQVDDTFEHLLWPGRGVSNKEKPFKAWEKAKSISDTNTLDEYPLIKDFLRFIYS